MFLFLPLLIGTIYKGQINLLDKQMQSVATPEVASLMKYSDFPSLGYIGKTDISIPIYNINFGKIKLPLGLSYNTKGNKVADIATSVGLGWSLNAGGNLTVKVNDMNDFTESYTYYTTATFEPELSLEWYRQSKGYLTKEYSMLVNNNNYGLCINTKIGANDDFFVDAAPDFYYINAPGFNDKFYLTKINDTQFKANFFNSTNAKLNNTLNLIPRINCAGFESTGFGNKGRAGVYYQVDEFEIIGENGYIYTFNDFESARLREYPQTIISHDAFQINNWYLTKIKDPYSGREMNFEYESYTNNYEHPSLTTLGDVNFGNYPMSYNYELGRMGSNFVYPAVFNKVTTSQLYPKRIKKITTDEEVVDFQYSFNRIDYPGNGLTNIQVKNKNGTIIKQTDFSYDYFNSVNCSSGDYECKRLKLNSITDSSLGTYRFYYDANSFPPRNSSKVDFLGYYNNNDSDIVFSKDNFHEDQYNYYPGTKIYFYPDLVRDQLLPFQLINKGTYATTSGVDRSAKTISKLGLLKRLIYPTGGSVELSYENDDFIYEGEKYILGSTRISKMKLYDSQNIVSKEINYKYVNEDNKSSGQINFIKTPANSAHTEISSGIGFSTDAIVGYSRIIEEVAGKGYVERKYSNFNDYPDKFMTSDYNFTDQGTRNFLKFLKFPSSYVQSFDERRGKPTVENYYKEGIIDPIKKIKYSYNYQVKDSLKVQKVFTSYDNYTHDATHNYTASNYLLRYFNNTSSNTKEDFFSGNNIKEENFYSYDDTRLTYKKTVSSGDTTEEYYRNAKDKSIQKLIDVNILDKPVEVEKKKNGKTLSKQEVKYENTSNIFPSSELSYDLSTNLMGTEVTYDKYDSKGNLLQYTTKNNIPVTVIWGYRQSQPIAKIEGANYTQIIQAFGLNTNDNNAYLDLDIVKKSDLHFDDTTESELISKLNDFRNKPALKDFTITTYTHTPLIGVKSITSASGNKEGYKYDTANRLEKVSDIENKTVKEYKYNYAPVIYYNNEKQQAFMTNNCAPGTLPASGTYTVSIGKYSSTISQADADQKAQNDINTNGQNYVNSHFNCTPYVCTITPTYLADIYYSSFQEISTNHIKAILSLPLTNSSGGAAPNWSNGVLIGTLDTLCRPNSYKSISVSTTNGSWNVSISPSGGVTLMSTSSSNPSGSTTLNFEYDK
ncbi:hypothetical protein SAMN05421841_3650 [Chryseobacterium wanjuense]|uniref:DUF5977 domain-containing protein n=2 Tax=Chryseobacterium wanjuense TaxID=356305 RepID=A0A1I0S118_9FLAO|nr:hypothetical protein SAMN05421841_3650 [Chryseobacterium wanjuense]